MEYAIVALLTIMTILMTFFIWQQNKLNDKVDKIDDFIQHVSDRLLVIETEHRAMKEQCRKHIE